ncbi:hypothetical protein T07_1220, partial [Trichinella nelsoni]
LFLRFHLLLTKCVFLSICPACVPFRSEHFYTVSSDPSNDHVRNKGVFIFSKILWMKRIESIQINDFKQI